MTKGSAGVRAFVVAKKPVMTVERRDAGRQCRGTSEGPLTRADVVPKAERVGAAKSRLANARSLAMGWGLAPVHRGLPTGKPDAGDPPVRFGREGERFALLLSSSAGRMAGGIEEWGAEHPMCGKEVID